MDLFDEPLEAAPQNFAIPKLAKLAVALEIAGQLAERAREIEHSRVRPRAYTPGVETLRSRRWFPHRPEAAPG